MRKVWFITRPERDPKFHVDALRALQIATDNFTVIWLGNRDAHKHYEAVLGSEELKRDNISNDGSGGRTWAAMLRTFGYVYLNSDGYLVLTKVGQKVLNSEKVRENISKQILTLQIPNAYFLDSGFRPKYEEDFQIRPARFLVRLVNQSILDYYVTKEEITFFALTAKRDDEIFNVTKRILDFRKASDTEKSQIKKSVATHFDHRQRADSDARDFASAHGDVAHTFMMLCDYTGFVDYVRGDALRLPTDKQNTTSEMLNYMENRYPFNKRYLISLERFAENAGLDIDSYKASAFGSLPPATNRGKSVKKVQRLLAAYPLVQGLTVEQIVEILEQELSTNEAKKFANELHNQNYESLNDDFVEAYLYEENDRVFEDKTGEILRSIGFNVEMRPKPLGNDVRTEIEILIHVDEETVCILDAKNYREKFTLSANLASHMASEYIPNYHGYEGKSVAYFGYVTANRFGGERHLEKICEKAKLINSEIQVSGVILSAKALLGFLDYCLEHELTKEERKERFISLFNNTGYENVGEMF
ncbi:AlwI family type II restriction endonuclease [Evansella cellulosilytica]|uniref:Restriction endonuclease, type II, AlwI n=1 Tax=Evansella cellulosilytica (strain ATCC 21833 / DSM 2522 / FERM P-1141 / JCM 9156 / N-4) TaxID=649639 RepID=E6TU30_EVAC2|nr:AlwI family type II restriction endonuclease [Evansella cellulosilytica]ADU28490.1 Restriction endonuclease, type II, AlwI [Evansella cellulosilytica DSM 2522]